MGNLPHEWRSIRESLINSACLAGCSPTLLTSDLLGSAPCCGRAPKYETGITIVNMFKRIWKIRKVAEPHNV